MSDINIDASLLQSEVSLSRTHEKLVEMSNGCICCTLREDLLEEVGRLARSNQYDYLIIESTGISEPLPVAETFTFEDEVGQSLSAVARLDTMVTVVDAANFLREFREARYLRETGESLGEEDERTIADLLTDQIEFADVIVLSKADLVEVAQLSEVMAVVRSLNPEATLHVAERGQVPVKAVLGTGRFDFARAQQAPGWLKEMRGEHVPETEALGISSFSYHARRPFHPERFHAFLHQPWHEQGKLIRSKGFFWLASKPHYACQWNQAGGIARYGLAGMFWKAIPESEWPEEEESLAYIRQKWQEPFGDMRQELVFIGQQLNEANLRQQLDACLLNEDEMLAGVESWQHLPDPFTSLEVQP